MFRRILGAIMLLIGLLTLALGIAGAIYSGQVIDSIGDSVDRTLVLLGDTMTAVGDTLAVTKTTVADTTTAFTTAEQTTANVAQTLIDTKPLLDGVSTVVTDTAPQNIEAVQATIPAVAEVAGVIDTTLTTLSDFGFEQQIPIPFSDPLTFNFDLGVDYAPEEPFDQSLLLLGDSLDGLPEQLRGLEGDLQTANDNLTVLSDDMLQLSTDLGAINATVAELQPLLDEYLRIVDQVENAIEQTRVEVATQLETVKLVVVIGFLFLGLTQLAPLYLGWELITGQREPRREDEEEVMILPTAVDTGPADGDEVVVKTSSED